MKWKYTKTYLYNDSDEGPQWREFTACVKFLWGFVYSCTVINDTPSTKRINIPCFTTCPRPYHSKCNSLCYESNGSKIVDNGIWERDLPFKIPLVTWQLAVLYYYRWVGLAADPTINNWSHIEVSSSYLLREVQLWLTTDKYVMRSLRCWL